MKATIDRDKCLGCGVCARVCSDGIKMADDKAVIKNEEVACLKEAAAMCPVNIIKIVDY